jgi:hypothetical protein
VAARLPAQKASVLRRASLKILHFMSDLQIPPKSQNFSLKGLSSENKCGIKVVSMWYQSIDITLVFGYWVFFIYLKGHCPLIAKNQFQWLNSENLAYSFLWGFRCK